MVRLSIPSVYLSVYTQWTKNRSNQRILIKRVTFCDPLSYRRVQSTSIPGCLYLDKAYGLTMKYSSVNEYDWSPVIGRISLRSFLRTLIWHFRLFLSF